MKLFRCEVRPGPEFILRKYKFFKNNSFELMQYYYADHQCWTLTFGVMAEGILHMTAPSWVVPGGMEADYLLSRVRVKPYSMDMAEVLMVQTNVSCPGYVTETWRANQWYTVYRDSEVAKDVGTSNDTEVIEDISCLNLFGLQFHELQLLRIENRKRKFEKRMRFKGRRTELLLGEMRQHYRPTSYQVPLLKSDQVRIVLL